MRRKPDRTSWIALSGSLALLALLIVLGILQYRWAGELGRAEQERLRAGLTSSTQRFAAEFDRELNRTWLHFVVPAAVDRETALVRLLAAWQETAPFPGLVRDVLVLDVDDEGRFRVRGLAPGEREFHDRPTDPRIEEWLRNRFSTRAGDLQRRRRPSPGMAASPILVPWLPAVLPPPLDLQLSSDLQPAPGRRQRPGSPPPAAASAVAGVVVVRLDRDYLAEELFPRLGERYFGAGEASIYRFAVLGEDREEGPVFQSDPDRSTLGREPADAEARMFRILPPEALRDFSREVMLSRLAGSMPPERSDRMMAEGRNWRRSLPPTLGSVPPASRQGAWRLVVQHRAGSLAAAVANNRRRNLLVGGGVLALLAVVVGMLVLSSRRAQELAARRVEFVAGVSHELRTPLAAIRSLGQNLADGIVEEPGAVRRYGGLIEAQSERLTGMVEQVLTYSGTLAGKKSPELRMFSPGDLVGEAVEGCRPQLTEAAVELEVEIVDPLPEIVGDAPALRGALENLIGNAAKFGGDGGWIGVRVTAEGDHGVRIGVTDRGPGVDAEERARIFEPFYRGRRAQGAQRPGSGLGLSLVQEVAAAHGGRIEVEDGAEGGAEFSLILPGKSRDAK